MPGGWQPRHSERWINWEISQKALRKPEPPNESTIDSPINHIWECRRILHHSSVRSISSWDCSIRLNRVIPYLFGWYEIPNPSAEHSKTEFHRRSSHKKSYRSSLDWKSSLLAPTFSQCLVQRDQISLVRHNDLTSRPPLIHRCRFRCHGFFFFWIVSSHNNKKDIKPPRIWDLRHYFFLSEWMDTEMDRHKTLPRLRSRPLQNGEADSLRTSDFAKRMRQKGRPSSGLYTIYEK
jgi:hypothetical protein